MASMRSFWLVVGCASLLAGCWVTRGEIRDKIHEWDTGGDETGDTGVDD